MSTSVGIGLVGAGAFGQFCLDAYHEMEQVHIAAVADVDEERAKSTAKTYNARAYTSLADMLRHDDVQIVALNTPPNLHARQGRQVIQAGRHLFCEKPLATSLEDARLLLAAAAAQGVRVTVNYVMRHNLFWQAAAKINRLSLLGALRYIDLSNHAAGLELPSSHWFWDKKISGGIWVEHGVHFFDAFSMVTRETGQIEYARRYTNVHNQNDRVEALAQYGQTAAHFYHAFDQSATGEQTVVNLTFERGYVRLDGWIPVHMTIVTPVDADNLVPLLPGKVKVKYTPGGRANITAYAPEGKSAVYRQCIQRGMSNLVSEIKGEGYGLAVTPHMALSSLKMAVDAENFGAAKG